MTEPADVSLRPETPEDLPFLRRLYRSTRGDEPEASRPGREDLDDAAPEAFALEHRQFRAHPHTWFTIITVDDKPIGRLYVSQSSSEMRVLDLALLPGFRRRGIGTQLVRSIQAEATRTRVPLRLRFERGNPATAFYRKLGFSLLGEGPTHLHLEWRGDVGT